MRTTNENGKPKSGTPFYPENQSNENSSVIPGQQDQDVIIYRINRLLSQSEDQKQARRDYSSLQEILSDHSNHILIAVLDFLSRKVTELERRISVLENAGKGKSYPHLMNCKAACDLLQMHPDTLNKYRKMGKIRALRMGKGFMYELADLLKLAEGK